MGLLQGIVALLLTLAVSQAAVDVSQVKVTVVTPRYGSLNGATRLTISGKGFSEDQFNFGEGRDKLGNQVKLVSETRSYDCDPHKDGNTKTQITCNTRYMVRDDYFIRISVDGEDVPEENHCSSLYSVHCRFSPHPTWTPTITSLGRLSHVPGEVQTINGKIMTSRFGSNVESTNARSQKILRVYAGGQLCDPRKDDGVDLPDVNDELYGIELQKNGKSDKGYMKCKMAGTYVGNSNFSFIIEDFGRSDPAANTFRVTAEDRITMFQTYAVVYNVTPSTGSEVGGTRLTINGRYFDETDAPASITIGDTSCKVVSVQDTVIYCDTEPKPASLSSMDKYPGNRGGHFGIYSDSALFSDFATAATKTEAPMNASFIDELKWSEADFNFDEKNYLARMSGFFVPPRNGSYKFNIARSDDESTLYFSETGQMSDLAQIAIRERPVKTNNMYSRKFTLQAKKAYPIVHVTRERGGSSYGEVAVHMSATSLPGGRAASGVRSEIQDIYTSSTVKNEIHTVKLDGWSSQSKRSEVQRVTVVSTNPSYVSFRIGMGGVWTAPLAGNAPATTVKTELNALPSIAPSSVTVVQGSISGGIKFDITFTSELGDVDMLTATLDTATNQADATLNVEERTKGKAAMSHFALKFMNAVSPPIKVTASVSDVETAVKALFEVRCPDFLSKPKSRVGFNLDYESDPEYWEWGTRVTDTEPFCGSTSIKNPRWLYSRHSKYKEAKFDLMSTGKVCFAYKGKLQQKIYTSHNYTTQTQSTARTAGDTFTVTIPEAKDWNYICIDLKALIEIKRSGVTKAMVNSIYIYRDITTTTDPIYIDNIMVLTSEPTTDLNGVAQYRRLRPPMWMIKDVSVTGDSSAGYRIDMALKGCPNNLPLFSVLGGEVSSSNGEISAVYGASTWKSGATVTVERELAASPPINGTFTLTLGSTQLVVPADIDENNLKRMLQMIPEVGDVSIERSGSCAGYKWRVTWATAPGDQEPITVDGSSLTGNNVTSGVNQILDGGVYFNPIPGDLLRTFNENQQVQVGINKIPSRCTGDCSFTWASEATPSLASITPTSGSNTAGTVVTLTGQGFSATNSENKVVIGGALCSVSSATSTEIQCAVGEGPAGAQDVVLNIDKKGLARNTNGILQFTYGFAISSISPTQGSAAGGVMLTVNGTGFSPNISATVGGSACPILSAAYSSFTCRTPAGSAGAVSVAVTDGSSSDTAGTQFTYSTADTPVITAVSSTTFQVKAGQTVTISGTGFGSSAGKVTINDQTATIVSYTDTAIQATLPLLPPGAYSLRVNVPGKGDADTNTNSIGQITYDLSVTNVFPLSGSMEGGSTVTVTGTGFPTDNTQVSVTVNGQVCAVSNSTNTQITCKAPSAGTVHHITNNGVHPTLGKYYAWSHPNLVALVGDSVKWTWAAPDRVASVYSVQETDSATGVSAKADGFSSGTKKSTGAFQYQFTTTGNYYYWSGYVDQAESIELRGIIKVEERPASSVAVEVKVNGHSATYNTASGVSNPASSGSCSPTYSNIQGCSEASPSSSGSGFEFKYLKCQTPIVSSISPNQGSAADTITIAGSGFGGTACQNEVTIGDNVCTISSSTTTEISCTVDAGGDAVIGIPEQVKLSVNNIGKALITESSDIKRYFVLLPHISAISPSEGSVKGGTEVTITGSGFYGQVTVAVGSVDCVISSLSYTQIKCVTNTASAGNTSLTVKVLSNGQNVGALCQAASSCDFKFSTSATPTVSSISPTTISDSSTELVISGTGFGSSSSDVNVTMGGEVCRITNIVNTAITCTVDTPVAGTHPVKVLLAGQGLADATGVTLTVNGVISSVQPVSGGVLGGNVISLTGVGFKHGDTTVRIGSNLCSQLDVKSSEIKCKAPSGSSGAVKIQVLSNSVSFPQADYAYTTSDTPTLTSLSTTSGKSGDSVTLTGTGFSSNTADMEVTIDGVQCSVNSASATSITCILGIHSAGKYPVIVTHASKGVATTDLEFTYTLDISSVTPSQGSYGGGQNITLAGVGFDASSTSVTVCDTPCVITGSVTATQLICTTPAQTISGATKVCDVKATVANQEATASSSFTYSQSLTPTISNVSPRRGGTGGGTPVTITGTGFGTDPSQVSVDIAGTTCALVTVTNTEVVCTTASRKPSIQTKIQLSVGTNGIATQDQADFEYIDVWSSQFTWNYNMPEAGDFVVIPSDMTVLLDTNTPVLKMLLINGGKLIFDEKDVELQAENILITNGGLLQVGTEAAPFQHKATITLHGHPRSQELPIYGTKTIAVREGTVDLHGTPPSHSWVYLGATVEAGQSQITLRQAVDWKVGDFIAIGSTGDHQSQRENEMRQITAVSNGGLTLTLASPLDYKHLGETIDLGSGHSLDAFAPVGLLTRNVLVRGSNNSQWASEKAAACPDGFNTGEFAAQTCFQGRFGEETGSDQYGAQIMFHPARPDEGLVTGRIENIEMTYAGQAFRIGRYAIHWHLNGNMAGNYVRRCAIHHSFNRAVNIHGTHYLSIYNNVVYDIMGGAIFLEDGIEIGNSFDSNLAIFVKGSSSLQNDDITPAAYWLTNPNNTVVNNVAAGGSHFGIWYRMHKNPDGPSYDPNYCPQHIPLGDFRNNTVISHGWFGIWIFKEYYPMEGGGCKSTTPIAAKWYSLIAWNCEKGAEWVGAGALQFHDFVMVNNKLAGIEMKLMSNSVPYSEESGGMIKGGIIVSRPLTSGKMVSSTTKKGIIVPYARGLLVKDTTFVNFDQAGIAAFGVTTVDGTSSDWNGGFTYRTSGLTFQNSPNKILWRWMNEGVYHDLDGTLTGIVNGKAVPTSGILPNAKCTHNAAGMNVNPAVPGSICQADVDFTRFSFNEAAPESLDAKNVSFTNTQGSVIAQFIDKRITHKNGWMVLLVTNYEYIMEFVNAGHLTNITYTGTFYDLGANEYVVVKHNVTQRPDHLEMVPGQSIPVSDSMVSYASDQNGAWFFDEPKTMVSYILSGKTSRRKKRGAAGLSPPESGTVDRDVKLKVYRCFTKGCAGSLDPNTLPPPVSRPADAVFWSNISTWKDTEAGWGGNYGDGSFGLPKDGDDVKIPSGVYVVADVPLPVMGKLYIYGTLELEYLPDSNGNVRDFIVNCTHIFINGGRFVVGWEDNRYTGNAQIVLRGDHFTPDIPLPSGPNMGSKVIGVFGGMELHGIERDVTWTRLSQTAAAGSNSIILQEAVDWAVGEEIVIAPTGYSAWETELMKITAVSSDRLTLTLNSTLKHSHLVTTTDVGQGKTVTFAAEVGLLTRNIKIIGAPYNKLYSEAFGARVLVGAYNDGVDYIGYARISNVEFYHTGQEGWSDDYDPRFSIAYLDLGDVDNVRPSSVRKCSFHHGFAPAIGTFATNKINVTDNVVYHTVGSSIQDSGMDNAFRRNLVTMMVFPGTFNGRDEGRVFWDAGFDIRRATRPIITGNAVAGSERAGYRVDGEPCDGSTEQWADNTAHSMLVGVEMLPDDGLTTCSQLGNFTVYKAWDFGIYFQVASQGVKVVGYTSADNTMGIYPMVLKPLASNHEFANKYVEIKESTFIGKTADFDCTNDKMTEADRNIFWSEQSRAWKSKSGGVVGIAVTTFNQATNDCPNKPWTKLMGYGSIGGLTTISGTTFVRYQSTCSGKKDVILTTNPSNDDVQHPVRLQAISLKDVDVENKIYFHRPNVGKINPADCVDMDCDGMKKIIIEDMDGTFLAAGKGTVIAESEFEWDVNPQRGLGDYRIPKTLLTDTSGNKIEVATIAPHKGIIRDNTCTYKSTWQAHECRGLDYEMLSLESMDSDTETRRLSPIALLGDGYLDLINGPQDHGWCMGYTCQKRISTFPIIVAMGKYFILHYTGTSPQHTRLRLLNAVDSQAFVIGIYYAIPQRLDVYVNDIYIDPTNTVSNGNGEKTLAAPTTSGQYLPNVANDAAGTNYFEKSIDTMHVLVRGTTVVEIKTSPLIIISFELPAMSTEDFYGANLVSNLATFLGIPASKIKVAKAVSENRNRRKRDLVFKVELEISNPPANTTNTTTPDADSLSYDQLQNITSVIVNNVQLGTLGSIINATILDFGITEPVPAPDSSAWKTVVATTAEGQAYNFQVQIPQTLTVETEPVGLSEGNVLSVHPVLKFLDKNGAIVQQLGSKTAPWQVTATLVKVDTSYSQVSLTGNTTVDFLLGYANFTNLIIDYSGRYRLDYRISYPAEAVSLFSAQSAEFTIAERTLALSVVSQDNETTVGQSFSAVAEIIDAITAVKVENIAWKSHTWTCTASLYMPDLYTGQLEGTLTVPIDPSTGLATFNDLRLTTKGRYYLKLVAVSTPAKYNMEVITGLVDARPAGWTQPVVEVSKAVKLRFNVDYNSTLSNGRAYLEAAIQNKVYASFSADNVTVGSVTFTEGSVMASFALEGSTTGVTSAVDSLHQLVSSGGFTLTFFGQTLTADQVMWVDNVEQAVLVTDTSSGLSAGLIAALVICCVVVLIAVIIALVLLKMKLKNKKNNDLETELNSNQALMNRGWVADESRGDVNPAAAGLPTQDQLYNHRRRSTLPEITLDSSNTTKPIPIAEQYSDEEPEESPETGRSGCSSRPQSRPPSKPSVVWDADLSARNIDLFGDIPTDLSNGVEMGGPFRNGEIAGTLPSLSPRQRYSVVTIDAGSLHGSTADLSAGPIDENTQNTNQENNGI